MAKKETKTVEEIRADARQRKRNQRHRDSALEEQLRLSAMDPGEARVRQIMAEIAQEPRQPRPSHATPEPTLPARLPTLAEWQSYLKSIPQTQAIAEEIIRVETAIAAGMTRVGEHENETQDF